jgi:STE24 endopeptidase
MVRIFWLLVVLWVVLRSGLLYLAWQGDQTPERKAQVLTRFSQEDIQKGKEYRQQGFVARVIGPFITTAILLFLVFGGSFSRWYESIEKWLGGGFWEPSLLFLLLYFVVTQLLSLPLHYYLGYVCEKRMGFSNMTFEAWVWRYVKSICVGWTIQGTGIMLILWLLKTFSRSWPLQLPVATTIFGVILTLLFPILVTPLFYDQKPLSDGPLKQKILEIADKSGVPVEGIYEINESKYSKHTNAYFTGLFSKKRIVLFDTLIKSHTVDETALIFAHEVGHWKHDHMFYGLFFGFLGTLLGAVAFWWVFPLVRAESAFGLREIWCAANVPLFALVFGMLNLMVSPVSAQISQHFERQADRASLELTELTQTFVDAEVRLARDNRADVLPHPWRVFWLYSHPPAIDRIQMALEYEAEKAKNRGGETKP